MSSPPPTTATTTTTASLRSRQPPPRAAVSVPKTGGGSQQDDDAPSPSPSPSPSSSLPPPLSTLLHVWDDLPAWRRDNAFIRSGYRSQRGSYAQAARSLLYLHNESVNIWSHLLGAVAASCVFLYYYYYYYYYHHHHHHDNDGHDNDRHGRRQQHQMQTELFTTAFFSPGDVVVFACFLAGAVACLGMSAAFHTLLDHSERVARWGNKLDYTGIVALIVGSYVPALYYGFFYCEPALFRLHLSVICFLGLACTVVSWVDAFRTPAWRPYRAALFIGLGLSGVIPLAHGVAGHGYQYFDERMGLSWVILQGVLYIFGAVLYATRFPERTLPGIFDIWGSSHQLFHCLVLLAAATHFYAMVKAFNYHHSGKESQCL